jgi:integrase-like protein
VSLKYSTASGAPASNRALYPCRTEIAWIKERPNLRPKTVELYQWLLARHIIPGLGGVEVGKLTAQMIRTWRADLLSAGVSVSTTAKAYRLLRAVLSTAVDEDKMLSRNPCRIRGAGNEQTPERSILTLAQVFELAELVGRNPVGNVRKVGSDAFRLRFREPDGVMSTSPVTIRARRRCSGRCGFWRRKTRCTSSTTGGSAPWCCSPPSRVPGGVR